jgi:hypothetical protein
VKRIYKRYQTGGDEALVHGNKGKISNNKANKEKYRITEPTKNITKYLTVIKKDESIIMIRMLGYSIFGILSKEGGCFYGNKEGFYCNTAWLGRFRGKNPCG